MIASSNGRRAVCWVLFFAPKNPDQQRRSYNGDGWSFGRSALLAITTFFLITFQTTCTSSVVGEAPHLVNVDGERQDVIYLGPAPPLTAGETLTVTAMAVDNDTYADGLEARLVWQRNGSDVTHNESMIFSNPPAGITGKWYYDLEITTPAIYRLQVIISDGDTWIYSDIRTIEWEPVADPSPNDEPGLKESASKGGAMFLMFLSFMGVGCVIIYFVVARRIE